MPTSDQLDTHQIIEEENSQCTREDAPCLSANTERDQEEAKVDPNSELTHQEVMGIVKTSLQQILTDPLLCDLPSDVTTEEINLQLALEYGQAMTVNVRRQDGEVLRK